MIKERLISEKDFTETNYERLKTTLIYIKKKNSMDSDGKIYISKLTLWQK